MAKEKKATKEVNTHPNRIGIKEAAGYTIAEAGNMFNLTYISGYLKLFMTDVLKIPASTAGIMLIITRLWDCINDPIWGAMVAKKSSNEGRKIPPLPQMGINSSRCFNSTVFFAVP